MGEDEIWVLNFRISFVFKFEDAAGGDSPQAWVAEGVGEGDADFLVMRLPVLLLVLGGAVVNLQAGGAGLRARLEAADDGANCSLYGSEVGDDRERCVVLIIDITGVHVRELPFLHVIRSISAEYIYVRGGYCGASEEDMWSNCFHATVQI